MEHAEIKRRKVAVRQNVAAALTGLTQEHRAAASQVLCRELQGQPFWRDARSVLCFAPMAEEIDVWPALREACREGKRIALPRYDKASRCYGSFWVTNFDKDVVDGYFGIREPAAHCGTASNLLDLILVPGVAFDTKGCRLGRGKGYYDRLLAALRGFTCGLCFDEQIVKSIPMEPHDVQLSCILTPTRLFHPGGPE